MFLTFTQLYIRSTAVALFSMAVGSQIAFLALRSTQVRRKRHKRQGKRAHHHIITQERQENSARDQVATGIIQDKGQTPSS